MPNIDLPILAAMWTNLYEQGWFYVSHFAAVTHMKTGANIENFVGAQCWVSREEGDEEGMGMGFALWRYITGFSCSFATACA